jgi:hypothetical protein
MCIAAAGRVANERNVVAVEAEAFATQVLQHYVSQAGISVQIEAVSLNTRPPTVYVRIPVDVDVDEYCANAELLFGDAIVLEPFGC